MKIFIAVIILPALSMGSASTQPSNLSYDAYRSVNNATAFPHVEAARHEQPRIKIDKVSTISFSEMNKHEKAIVVHSFTNNSTSCAHQKMVEGHEKKLNKNETNIAPSLFNELNAGDKTALIHERINNAGAETHQIQARNLRRLYKNKE